MPKDAKNKAIERKSAQYPGYRHMSGSSRYNARMSHIFEESKRLNAIHDTGRAKHLKEKHGGDESTYSSCKKCFPK